jgi:hypothetical protein
MPFRASDIIPLGAQPQEKKRVREGARDENGVEAPAVLMQNKYVRMGKKEIERGQTVVAFAVTKNHRLRCQVRFNYCGNEKQRLTEALDTLRRGVSKLEIVGWLLVSNELLVWLVSEFPLLSSVKIYLEDPLCNQVTDAGISGTIAAAPQMRKFHLNHLRNIGVLCFKSPHMEGLSLKGLSSSCTRVDIGCPRLSNLELQFDGHVARNVPLAGLPETIMCCAKNLRWLCVTYPFAAEDLYFLDYVSQIQNLGIRLPSIEALRHKVPYLAKLELHSSHQLDLNQLIEWKVSFFCFFSAKSCEADSAHFKGASRSPHSRRV